MKLRSIIAAVIVVISAGWAGAATDSFEENLNFFKKALQDADISVNELNRFLKPRLGQGAFRLDENNAPWAGNYFSMRRGGLAYRWNQQAITPENMLSAIEKYDYYMGYADRRATNWERVNRGDLRDPKAKAWEGFCNGVRCAGFLLPEPVIPVNVTAADGTTVTFEPADLKALAGASYFYVEKYAQLGAPTFEDMPRQSPNPAVLDLALRYYLAEKRKPFVIDSHPGAEIWNETVVGYDRVVSSRKRVNYLEAQDFPEAASKVIVTTVLETLGEIGIRDSNRPTKADVSDGLYSKEPIPLRYTLYLNAKGEIIDGRWMSVPRELRVKNRGVDFVWFAGGKGTDSSNGGNPHLKFEVIQKLIRKSAIMSCRTLLQ